MADILTLADARAALRLAASDTSNDADLTTTYIPAVTPMVEDLTGPLLSQTGLTRSFDGGKPLISLPSAVTAVTTVTESNVTLTQGTDYIVNLRSGVVQRGTMIQPYPFLPGQQNIVVTYNVGAGIIPPNVKLAARIILRQLWQADQQGNRPQFGQPDGDTVTTPSGFAIPKRAFELLQPTQDVPGFG